MGESFAIFLRTVLLNNKDKQFFAPNFLFSELFRHKEKLMHKTQASEEQIYEFLEKILQVIHFVNDELIATENIIEAHRLCRDIDLKDMLFVALTLEIRWFALDKRRNIKKRTPQKRI